MRQRQAKTNAQTGQGPGDSQRLQATIDGAGIGTFELNLRSGAIALSQTSAELFGTSEHIPGTWPGLLALVHADDRANVEREIANAGESRDGFEVDYRVLLSDGGVRWLRQRGRRFRERDDAPEMLRGVIFDIDE
jgi:PAS domain-containing protein